MIGVQNETEHSRLLTYVSGAQEPRLFGGEDAEVVFGFDMAYAGTFMSTALS
jgi:hypothetical protein